MFTQAKKEEKVWFFNQLGKKKNQNLLLRGGLLCQNSKQIEIYLEK